MPSTAFLLDSNFTNTSPVNSEGWPESTPPQTACLAWAKLGTSPSSTRPNKGRPGPVRAAHMAQRSKALLARRGQVPCSSEVPAAGP